MSRARTGTQSTAQRFVALPMGPGPVPGERVVKQSIVVIGIVFLQAAVRSPWASP